MWITCLKMTCGGRRAVRSPPCITRVSVVAPHLRAPLSCKRQGSVSHRRLCTGKCLCKEKKLRSASELCRTKHDYGRRDYFLLTGGLETDFRGLTPCLMQSSRPVCCPLTTKEPMQRCESKFGRSFTQAKGRSPWAPSASTLCPGPKMAALVLS